MRYASLTLQEAASRGDAREIPPWTFQEATPKRQDHGPSFQEAEPNLANARLARQEAEPLQEVRDFQEVKRKEGQDGTV
jgi:hypothetical protein